MDLRSQQVRLWRYRIQKFEKINFRFSTRVGKLKTTNTTWTTVGQQRATHLQSQYTFHFLTFNFNQDCCDDRVAAIVKVRFFVHCRTFVFSKTWRKNNGLKMYVLQMAKTTLFPRLCLAPAGQEAKLQVFCYWCTKNKDLQLKIKPITMHTVQVCSIHSSFDAPDLIPIHSKPTT